MAACVRLDAFFSLHTGAKGRSMVSLPFLTSYDPPGSSEGTLDPLGLYQIADQLAVRLVPAVRERMQRIRFLTAMAIGSVVTEGIQVNPQRTGVPPFIVWEWLVVQAIVGQADVSDVWGVPGTLVTGRALKNHGYLDESSYLKTPRIFGFHGVYKRLAIHLGLVDVHLGPRPEGERLVDAWARDRGLAGLREAAPLLQKWKTAVQKSLDQSPPRTLASWNKADWAELAAVMLPHDIGGHERSVLHELLHAGDERALGALPTIWTLQKEFQGDDFSEEQLHRRLLHESPGDAALIEAIQTYENFCRGLHDAFGLLRAEAGTGDGRGYEIARIAQDAEFAASVDRLDGRFATAHERLGALSSALAAIFAERFKPFDEPLAPGDAAVILCQHHEAVQKAKSESGKRAWFDRPALGRIYMRQSYRQSRQAIEPHRYVHDYRGRPIRDFHADLK